MAYKHEPIAARAGVGVDFIDRARAMNAGGTETLPECPYCG